LLTSRQIFWYAVPARTVTKSTGYWLSANISYAIRRCMLICHTRVTPDDVCSRLVSWGQSEFRSFPRTSVDRPTISSPRSLYIWRYYFVSSRP